MAEVAVSIEDVSKRFRLYHERGTSLKERLVNRKDVRYTDLWALDHVSFEVAEGETVGILGHNGSGKSTLLKCVCGVLQPTSGQVVVRGKLAGLLELGAGFQAELSGRDNIYLNGSMLGLSKAEVDEVYEDIVEFAELEQFIDNQVKFYSSGMYVRLGFAVAVNVDPDILVIDEVLAVGDERFQRKCLDRIRQFQEMGRTIIFVSHSPDQVRSVCDRAVVLNEGVLIGMGSPGEAVRTFRESLLEADEAEIAEQDANTVAAEEAGDDEVTAELPPHERPIRIGEVSVHYPGDDERPYLESRQPVQIHVGYVATEPIDGALFALEIYGPRGGLLVKTDTDILGEHFDVEAGEGEVIFSFDSWTFMDGAYTAAAGIRSRLGGMTYDWREGAAQFEVLYQGRASGLVNLPLEAMHRAKDIDQKELT